MPKFRDMTILSAAALGFLTFLTPTIAAAQEMEEKIIATRQGYMKLVLWEAGPLFGMAKGDMAYDAASAASHAANLKTISQYQAEGLFLAAGTYKEDRPGKTRALAKLQEDKAGFEKAFAAWRTAVAGVADQAGNGQEALAAAVGELGKSCGGCHTPYRAKEF